MPAEKGSAVCSGCGESYLITPDMRRPKVSRSGDKGIRCFCPRCRQSGIPSRLSSRAWWRKKQQQKIKETEKANGKKQDES